MSEPSYFTEETSPFRNTDVNKLILSFLVDWTCGSGSEHEDSEIDFLTANHFRLSYKAANQAFELWGGLRQLRKSLNKETMWKIKQYGNLMYALDCRTGPCTVGMLGFPDVESTNEFMVELRSRVRFMELRAEILKRKICSPALREYVEPISFLDRLQGAL